MPPPITATSKELAADHGIGRAPPLLTASPQGLGPVDWPRELTCSRRAGQETIPRRKRRGRPRVRPRLAVVRDAGSQTALISLDDDPQVFTRRRQGERRWRTGGFRGP